MGEYRCSLPRVRGTFVGPQPSPFTYTPASSFDPLTADAVRIRDELYARGVSATGQDEAVDLLAPLSLDEVAA